MGLDDAIMRIYRLLLADARAAEHIEIIAAVIYCRRAAARCCLFPVHGTSFSRRPALLFYFESIYRHL